ncbi:transposase [Streptomyces sp. NPDC059176]|uniref:transposase n=1 Tax=unclassified Streptomyces TaxID=2593676 RepID=UPI00367CDA14
MSRNLWKRPFVLLVASLAIASGAACAAHASPNAATGATHPPSVGDMAGRFAECGKGGDGGKGGSPGRPGEPGRPGQAGCLQLDDLPGMPSDCGKVGAGGKGGEPGQAGEPGQPGTLGCFRLGELPDKAKGDLTVVDKVRIVLAVMSGDTTRAEVAKKYRVSEEVIDAWRKQFLEGDWTALMAKDTLVG